MVAGEGRVTADAREPAAECDVRLVRVTKRYRSTVALEDLSLDVRRGEFLCLLGPSGGGKTTVLRLVAGLVMPTSGGAHIRGRDMTLVPTHLRDGAMVFQNYALFPHMTVRENVGFGLRMRGRDGPDVQARVAAALELVRLSGLDQRYPHQLSGGQQQRVALARCLVVEPSVLLLDEPLGALDRQLRESMQVELKLLQRRVGVSTVLVTHDQEEALAMADRIAVINHGRLEQLGTPREIYERPRTRFVATFIGVNNVLEGKVETIDGDRMVVVTGRGLRVTATADARWRVGDTVVLSLRPERIGLGRRPPAASANAATGHVVNTVYLGERTR
jgi:spermidine/putrescine ABC transporter ATP-binding subunit